MPQGFKNSPAIFQRVMNLVLNELIGVSCVVYIDDILVFGRNVKEHDDNLNKVLDRLSHYQLKENIHKRVERVESIKFLGYEISFNRISPSLDRAQGIVDYAIPRTKKRNFKGLLG
ncbi:Retrovirus-related Pol polyprotein from transposon 17.6 [Dictyocoela roeselum]|nr:Retrovirus-related Pol polyprotein from transposon 17.6 [Dictyocoela roeselum]